MSPPIKVLHVLEAVRGGTSRHVVDLVRSAPGVTHHVAAPVDKVAAGSGAVVDQAAIPTLTDADAVVHPVGMRRSPVHPANILAAWRLRRLIREIDPEVVHGHSSVGGALARLSAVGLRIPVFYTPHGLMPNRAYRLIEKLLGRFTNTLVAVSPSEGSLAIEWGLVARDRVAVVPNGIDIAVPDGPCLDIRLLAGIPSGAPLVGTVIRLVPQKAPELFVAVCAEVAKSRGDAHFLLIGLGPMQERVDKAVAECGLQGRWHQIPHLSQAADVLGQLDVFALLSAFEGGPYTPLESMRSGVPVVLTDVVGNRDVVESGVSGLVAPFGDVKALAEGIVSLLDDPTMAGLMALAARRRFEEKFDVRAMGAATTELYHRAARAGRRSTPARA